LGTGKVYKGSSGYLSRTTRGALARDWASKVVPSGLSGNRTVSFKGLNERSDHQERKRGPTHPNLKQVGKPGGPTARGRKQPVERRGVQNPDKRGKAPTTGTTMGKTFVWGGPGASNEKNVSSGPKRSPGNPYNPRKRGIGSRGPGPRKSDLGGGEGGTPIWGQSPGGGFARVAGLAWGGHF